MSEKIKLARYRNTSYFVRYNVDGAKRQWSWAGSRNGKVETHEVPKEVVEWLQMNTICFDKGELVIVEETETAKEAKEGIIEKEVYESNTHSREDILKIIGGNINKMKAELKKITVDSEKQFVIDVASSLKDELTKGKLDFLAEWMNIDASILFD